jgi:hypothetical protein
MTHSTRQWLKGMENANEHHRPRERSEVSKRLGQPRQTPGMLKFQWGKLRDEDPDFIVAWGQGCHRADAGLLLHMLTGQKPFASVLGRDDGLYAESLAKELEKRGYDITTMKFSIKKKGVK